MGMANQFSMKNSFIFIQITYNAAHGQHQLLFTYLRKFTRITTSKAYRQRDRLC
jgi:hypothetical protein